MRCDRCPLCPSDDEAVCCIAEGELGLEHKDGMWGCKHSWNWCKKQAEEYRKNIENNFNMSVF